MLANPDQKNRQLNQTIGQLASGWVTEKEILKTQQEALDQQHLISEQLQQFSEKKFILIQQIQNIHDDDIKRLLRKDLRKTKKFRSQFLIYKEKNREILKKISIRKLTYLFLCKKLKLARKYADNSQKLNEQLAQKEAQKEQQQKCIQEIQEVMDLRVQTEKLLLFNENLSRLMERQYLRKIIPSLDKCEPYHKLMIILQDVRANPSSILKKLAEFFIKIIYNMSRIVLQFNQRHSTNQEWEDIQNQIGQNTYMIEQIKSKIEKKLNKLKIDECNRNHLLGEQQKFADLVESSQWQIKQILSIPVLVIGAKTQGQNICDHLNQRVTKIQQQLYSQLDRIRGILLNYELVVQRQEEYKENQDNSPVLDEESQQQFLQNQEVIELNHQLQNYNNFNFQLHEEQEMDPNFEENKEN